MRAEHLRCGTDSSSPKARPSQVGLGSGVYKGLAADWRTSVVSNFQIVALSVVRGTGNVATMKFSSAVISSLAVIVLSAVLVHAGRQERQVLSMSRFSSSGLVFPGPPGQGVRPQQGDGEQMTRRSAQLAQPVRVRGQQAKFPAVPLSLIGKQPDEFIAAARQRQQEQEQEQQQQQQLRAQQFPEASPKQNAEEEEEEFADDEEYLPRPVRPLQRQDVQRPAPRPQQQQREEPDRPVVRPQQREEPPRSRPRPVQPQQQEIQRPEPSIQQAVQQRRPNYPPNYKPRPQEVNALEEERLRPPQSQEPEQEASEEEEEVKPDKLQLLLLKTQFNCADKKDGYYADEEVDCEIFHYCQDRIRHSWLCPEGASFHQVHLICMPISKENICKKSSQFHFVNDYLYKPLQDEDGNNSTLYADRYYPDGYEPGFDMAEVEAPEKPKLQAYNRRPLTSAEVGNGRRRPTAPRQGNENNRKSTDPRRPPFPIASADEEEDSFFKSPVFRGENRRMSFRRPVPAEEDFSGEEEEE